MNELRGDEAASRRIARNAAWRSAGEIVAKAASLVFFLAVARELGRQGFGNLTFALALGAILAAPAGFGTDPLVARDVARDAERVHQYLPNVIAIKATTSAPLLLLVVAVGALGGWSSERLLAVLVVGGGVAAENLARSCYAVLQAFERLELVSLCVIAQRVLTAAVAVAVLAAGGGVVSVALVYALGAALAFLLGLWLLGRHVVRVRWRVEPSRWREIAVAGLPIGVATALFTVLLTLDSVLLGLFRESGEVGVYGAAFRLVEATMFVSWVLNAAMLPWFARRSAADAERLARGYELGQKALVGLLVPAAVALGLLARPLIELLYGDEYSGAVTPLRVLAALIVLYGISHFTGNFLLARDRPGSFVRAAGAALVVNLAANVALIPAYGATGAAAAAVGSSAVLVVAMRRSLAEVAGRVHVLRIVGGPLIGGLAMAAVIVAAGVPPAVALVCGVLAYAAAFTAVELIAWPDDVRFARQVFLSRRRPVSAVDR